MKKTSLLVLFFVLGFISCKIKEAPNIADNNIDNRVLEIVDDPYLKYKIKYKYEYDDDKYIVFNDGMFISYVFIKKQSLDYTDYENDKPVFTLEKNDLAFFKHIIDDVLIFTYGTVSDPVVVRFFDLLDGNDLFNDDLYLYKAHFFMKGGILLKKIGYRDELTDEQLAYIDQDIYKEELEYLIRRTERNEDDLMYYQAYVYDFVHKTIEPVLKIIPYLSE
jgi:hypothetical protein